MTLSRQKENIISFIQETLLPRDKVSFQTKLRPAGLLLPQAELLCVRNDCLG